jgi:predicted nuclease with RNAse H fold
VTWAGVDVGGRRKGFHVAVLDEGALVDGPVRLVDAAAVAAWLDRHQPELVAVDSPLRAAPDGLRSRPCERRLAREVCGIRYTPDRNLLGANPYYEWIVNGFGLYEVLELAGFEAIECFPTASWTRWAGPRRGTRAAWSARALAGLLPGTPRLSQDGRDAIAAALTARSAAAGAVERFGEIVLPLA